MSNWEDRQVVFFRSYTLDVALHSVAFCQGSIVRDDLDFALWSLQSDLCHYVLSQHWEQCHWGMDVCHNPAESAACTCVGSFSMHDDLASAGTMGSSGFNMELCHRLLTDNSQKETNYNWNTALETGLKYQNSTLYALQCWNLGLWTSAEKHGTFPSPSQLLTFVKVVGHTLWRIFCCLLICKDYVAPSLPNL